MLLPICIFVFVLIAVVYIFLIMPRVVDRADMDLLSTDYAHRGLHSSTVPENSLAAFSAACDAGYGIELDVQMSRDGKIFVFHDDTLERAAQNGTQRSLHLVGAVEHFSDYGDDGKGEAQANADDGHAPVNAGDGAVFKENIGQEGILTIVADLHLTGEHLKEFIGQRDQVADGGDNEVEKTSDGVVQYCANAIVESVADEIGDGRCRGQQIKKITGTRHRTTPPFTVLRVSSFRLLYVLFHIWVETAEAVGSIVP